MKWISNCGAEGRRFAHLARAKGLASFDLEWTKNYRIKNGNRPFCWSVVVIPFEGRDDRISMRSVRQFRYQSVYGEAEEEIDELVFAACRALEVIRQSRQLELIGHQLPSDLSVLLAWLKQRGASGGAIRRVDMLRKAWRNRHEMTHGGAPPSVFDTRYDVDKKWYSTSHRLVDVATTMSLDVDQPELGTASMTALQRAFWQSGDPGIRERLSVLNLRHALSAAIVCAKATGRLRWRGTLNVNQLLASRLADKIAYVRSKEFGVLARKGARTSYRRGM